MNPAEKKEYLKSLEGKTDRELQELQTYYQLKSAKNSERIKNNVVFFFWAFLAGFILMAIGLLQMMDSMKKPY
jgi:hypothetical protein